jgi:REP element-mobilizing transposase RayT
MTAPRQVLKGATYLVTRRCFQRQFLLKPTKTTREVCLYLLAVAARRFHVDLHAYCFLSNHFHLVVTDPHGRLPAFVQYFDGLVARAVNAHLGRWESFWAPDSFSAVTLGSPTDVVAKAAYTLANPVAGGLVRSARQWPGLWSAPEAIGAGEVPVPRPKHFFAKDGSLPESVGLALTVPPGFPTPDLFRQQLADALATQEAEAVRRRAGAGFLGVLRVLAQAPTARPRPGEPRRGLKPRVAARDKWKRIELLGRLATFVSSYREALSAWRDGMKEVLFPEGTYLMRVAHGVACRGTG